MARGFNFWATVGAVMTALKLKDAYDDYQELPQNEHGQRQTGPISLHSPIDEESHGQGGNLELDTTLPTAGRPKRKCHADCCVCCGLRCGIFWKAFGAVLALFFIWQALRFIFWSGKPASTGLENMPEFSTSLTCKDASYTFNPDTKTYSVPFNLSNASHHVYLNGDAFGTLIVTEGADDATDIKYDFILKSNDESLLSRVSFKYPTQEQVDSGTEASKVTLETPVTTPTADKSSQCMRFDIVLYVPPQLKNLTISSSSLTHLKFASRTGSRVNLDDLDVSMHSSHGQNLVLPTTSVRATNLRLRVSKGYLVGDVSILNSTTIDTTCGDAIANLHVYPSLSQDEAKFTTRTGDGRANFFFMHPTPSHSDGDDEHDHDDDHRQITSKHTASGTGDLYLKYEKSGFSGRVSLKAGSSTTKNMHAFDFHKSFTRGWVRDEDGKDRLNIKAGRNTWVGLYF
ncbi:hypothetical protein BDY19DRAFT_993509 [Irpex rosettiformis]|uniref:Uncharacterized protein n=1 Tax=Irpex rosettiformis TaxID=378272 RepID=A0ACB8U4H6_9APHY|nr:hypothetical protein BDY19DRAFT_993509 [Irpex rosettiformis]